MSEVIRSTQALSAALPAQTAGDDASRIREQCREVEGIFLQQLLSAMDRSPWGEGLLSSGSGERVFNSLRNRELAGELAQREALGLSEMLYRELSGASSKDAP